ncbi:MAG: DUF2157 domain-containing protein [Proteobacteria bacterium]|nr:DUF2157 domain-containing protein [Pseudomonadota bacterium]
MNRVDRIAITRHDLQQAAGIDLLPMAAVEPLWQHLRRGATAAAPLQGPRFAFTNILYYLGGALAIGAATLFMNEGFQRLGPWGLLVICVLYGAGCVWAAGRLAARGLEVPAGIVATLAVCLVPLATWSVQNGLGLWPDGESGRYASYHTRIDWRWLTLELATLAAAAVALWRLRYPFLMMPVAVTLWYMSMDLARLIVEPGGREAWTFYRDFSLFFGLLMLLFAFWVDARSRAAQGSRRDYAFWPYLLGMLTFWIALTLRDSNRELDKLLYGLLNLGFIGLAALLQRRVFAVCGGFGLAFYLGHLSARLFKDSLLFPLALTAIGLALIAGGIWWQRNEDRIQAALQRRLPAALRGWLPS